eukprot:CAMPEP_0185456904 /NCGR_PEP_ID=MMETSP1365-20130426/78618_1 /TAXON_ID=38817 /ORGANISM="Gephyrocapsa oceanica, Strain RCC1303" /LENGTH=65 /DNA_ID=CAMNT_0028063347 /DNA_START=42 /DNA_END=236 /DNA_ORIENTATION=-
MADDPQHCRAAAKSPGGDGGGGVEDVLDGPQPCRKKKELLPRAHVEPREDGRLLQRQRRLRRPSD